MFLIFHLFFIFILDEEAKLALIAGGPRNAQPEQHFTSRQRMLIQKAS